MSRRDSEAGSRGGREQAEVSPKKAKLSTLINGDLKANAAAYDKFANNKLQNDVVKNRANAIRATREFGFRERLLEGLNDFFELLQFDAEINVGDWHAILSQASDVLGTHLAAHPHPLSDVRIGLPLEIRRLIAFKFCTPEDTALLSLQIQAVAGLILARHNVRALESSTVGEEAMDASKTATAPHDVPAAVRTAAAGATDGLVGDAEPRRR